MKAIPKSRTGSKNLAMNGSRSWQATPVSYFKVIPKSRTGEGTLASNGTRTEMSAKKGMSPIDKSMPAVPTKPRKWTSRGYSMTSPS